MARRLPPFFSSARITSAVVFSRSAAAACVRPWCSTCAKKRRFETRWAESFESAGKHQDRVVERQNYKRLSLILHTGLHNILQETQADQLLHLAWLDCTCGLNDISL